MKLTIFLFAFGSLFNSLLAQDHPIDSLFPLNENKKVEFDSVFTLENTTKNDIYNSLQEFVNKFYTSSLEENSRVNDRESGLISFLYGDTKVSCGLAKLKYTVTIKIKDNKYRVNFSNFILVPAEKSCWLCSLEEPNFRYNLICGMVCAWKPRKEWILLRENVSKSVNKHFSDIKTNISKNLKDKSNW